MCAGGHDLGVKPKGGADVLGAGSQGMIASPCLGRGGDGERMDARRLALAEEGFKVRIEVQVAMEINKCAVQTIDLLLFQESLHFSHPACVNADQGLKVLNVFHEWAGLVNPQRRNLRILVEPTQRVLEGSDLLCLCG